MHIDLMGSDWLEEKPQDFKKRKLAPRRSWHTQSSGRGSGFGFGITSTSTNYWYPPPEQCPRRRNLGRITNHFREPKQDPASFYGNYNNYIDTGENRGRFPSEKLLTRGHHSPSKDNTYQPSETTVKPERSALPAKEEDDPPGWDVDHIIDTIRAANLHGVCPSQAFSGQLTVPLTDRTPFSGSPRLPLQRKRGIRSRLRAFLAA